MDAGQVAYIAFLALILGYAAGRLHESVGAEQRSLRSELSGLRLAVADFRRREPEVSAP